MVKLICDRCGAEIKYPGSFRVDIHYPIGHTKECPDKVDLCTECIMGLLDYLGNEEE